RGQESGVSNSPGGPSVLTPAPSPLAPGLVWLREDGSPLPPEEHPVRRVLRAGAPVRNVVLGIRPEARGQRSEVRKEGAPESPSSLTSDLCPLTSDLSSARVRWVLVNSLPLA